MVDGSRSSTAHPIRGAGMDIIIAIHRGRDVLLT